MQRFGGRLLEEVAYESRTARAKLFFRQPRMEWYIYSKKNNESLRYFLGNLEWGGIFILNKIMKVCFPLLIITGTFIDKIISYSMWQFIYGSTKNV